MIQTADMIGFADTRIIPRGTLTVAAGAVGVFDMSAVITDCVKRIGIEVTGAGVKAITWPTAVTTDLTTVTSAVTLRSGPDALYEFEVADQSKLDGYYNPIELHGGGTVQFRGIVQGWGTNLPWREPRNGVPAGTAGLVRAAAIAVGTPVITNAVRWLKPSAIYGRTIPVNTGHIMLLDTHNKAIAFFNTGAVDAVININELG